MPKYFFVVISVMILTISPAEAKDKKSDDIKVIVKDAQILQKDKDNRKETQLKDSFSFQENSFEMSPVVVNEEPEKEIPAEEIKEEDINDQVYSMKRAPSSTKR